MDSHQDAAQDGAMTARRGANLPDQPCKAPEPSTAQSGARLEALRCSCRLLLLLMVIRFIQAMLGHAELSTTEIYTQVSIRLLKSVHAATHPGRMPDLGRHALDLDPTAEDLLAALALEAAEEDEG